MKHVQISWEPAEERFVATGTGGHQVLVNAPHPGDPDRRVAISPAELLLVAAGTCSAWDVVEILRKQRQPVDGVDVHVSGDQESEAPWTFREIVLEFTVRGRGVNPELAERAVRLSEEKYCSVTTTIRRGATVRSTLEVTETTERSATPSAGDPAGTAPGELAAGPALDPARDRGAS